MWQYGSEKSFGSENWNGDDENEARIPLDVDNVGRRRELIVHIKSNNEECYFSHKKKCTWTQEVISDAKHNRNVQERLSLKPVYSSAAFLCAVPFHYVYIYIFKLIFLTARCRFYRTLPSLEGSFSVVRSQIMNSMSEWNKNHLFPQTAQMRKMNLLLNIQLGMKCAREISFGINP